MATRTRYELAQGDAPSGNVLSIQLNEDQLSALANELQQNGDPGGMALVVDDTTGEALVRFLWPS